MSGTHDAAAADSWFRGLSTDTPFAWHYARELRALAEDWVTLGLSPARSLGIPAPRPLLGIEVPHHPGDLRWLWVLLVEGKRDVRLECSWGDGERLNDWGPNEGDVDFVFARATASARQLARYANFWITDQASIQP
jgi:hypothetical protein